MHADWLLTLAVSGLCTNNIAGTGTASAAMKAKLQQGCCIGLDKVTNRGIILCHNLGRVVDLSEDQDSTDLQKCVSCVERRMAANPACWTETTIFAVGVSLHLSSYNHYLARAALLECDPCASVHRL